MNGGCYVASAALRILAGVDGKGLNFHDGLGYNLGMAIVVLRPVGDSRIIEVAGTHNRDCSRSQ
jgi:hypothetical protein